VCLREISIWLRRQRGDWNNNGDILISLTPDHTPTERLHEKFPCIVVFFEAANITNQILNSGLPAPIDVQVTGRDAGPNHAIAQRLSERIARIPGAADVHVHQVVDAPELRIEVDRTKAGQLGLTQRNVANSLLISLSGSSPVAPNFWLNWRNGVSDNLLIQTPKYKLDDGQADANARVGGELIGGVQHAWVHGGRG
jgi:multidrug efflux pump subunit AcrB